MKYCQCELENITLLSNDKFKITIKLVSFIPEKFAIKDNIIKLKNDKGDWEEGWVVKSVGKPVDESFIPDSHVAIKNHRKRTGDSLPK